MDRALRILGWTAGVLVLLTGIALAGGYFFLTSDYVHGQLESRASEFSGRKTKIAKVKIDWGATTHPGLGASAAGHVGALCGRSRHRLWRDQAQGGGQARRSVCLEGRQCEARSLRTEPVGDLSAAGHSRPADAALSRQRPARARAQ